MARFATDPAVLTPRGEGYCPLETAYGHGGPTEYCQNESHGDDGWCLQHLAEWGYTNLCPDCEEDFDDCECEHGEPAPL